MAMGRGSCKTAIALFLLICMVANTLAVTHTVGDSQGWGFSASYTNWANKQSFAAGDALEFNYQAGVHNVVPVNAAGYRNCKAGGSTKAVSTGNDKVTLKRGANYFICSLPGHCEAGMKIQVVAN